MRNYGSQASHNVKGGVVGQVGKSVTDFSTSETIYNMNEITQNDVVAIGRSDGRRRVGVGAQSSTLADAAERATDAGSEGGGGAEWQIVTRGNARVGGAKRTTAKLRSNVAEDGRALQEATPGFKAVSTAACKRKAEDSINDKLTAIQKCSIQHWLTEFRCPYK